MAIGSGANRPKDKTIVSPDRRLILEWDAYFQRLDERVSSLISGTAGVNSFEGRTGAVVATAGDYTASEITNVPSGDVSAITVQAALNELDTEKYNAGDSPSFLNETLTGYLDLTEISAPANPASNVARLFAVDDGHGFTRLRYKDSNGYTADLLRNIVNVRDFGATGDGTTDDSAAIIAAKNSVGTDDLCLYFPAGQYVLNSTLSFTDKNVTIKGDGEGLSRIVCQNANAVITFSDSYNGQDDLLVQRFNMSEISMAKDVTTSSGLGGTAVTLTWAYTGVISVVDHACFTNVTISAHSFTKFWHKAIQVNDGGMIRITGCRFYNEAINTNSGPCIEIKRDTASNITTYYIANSIFANWNTFITFIHEAASQNGTIEGVYITNCEILGVQIAFNDDNDSNANHQINVVSVANSHLDVSSRLAFWGWISGFRLTGCGLNLLDTGGDPSSGGEDFIVAVLAAFYWTITGNRIFRSTGVGASTCLVLPGDPNVSGIVVMGNSFENWTNVSALVSGSATRTQAVAIWGPNILQSSGSYGAIGIITDFENGPYRIAQDYANNLLKFTGPTSGFTFDAVIKPASDDGAALGTTALKWSDLFLASGGVVNWNNGDVTVTHGSNVLAFAGAASGYSFDNVVAAPINLRTVAAVNFNSANTDTSLTINLPPGYTRYRISNVIISGSSASISTATFGLFTAAAAGGQAIVANPTAITVTTASEATNNNMQTVAPTNANTESFNQATLFFRVITAQGSAATATVTINYTPVS